MFFSCRRTPRKTIFIYHTICVQEAVVKSVQSLRMCHNIQLIISDNFHFWFIMHILNISSISAFFGVNGAFFTGDAFNLFVFFEVLLIASYSLLMHGGDKHNTRAALQYVIMNLVGSAVFLIALGILYGVLGTLNMADMANKVTHLEGDDVFLAKIGGLLLLVVFALKGALLPLHLWLPNTYATAHRPCRARKVHGSLDAAPCAKFPMQKPPVFGRSSLGCRVLLKCS